MGETIGAGMIIVPLIVIVFSIALVISPLVIWHHLAKFRAEFKRWAERMEELAAAQEKRDNERNLLLRQVVTLMRD